MKITIRHLLIISLCIFFANSSCSKINKLRLEGKWNVITISDVDSEESSEEWTFDKDGTLHVIRIDIPGRPMIESGSYVMITRRFFKVTGFTHNTLQYYNFTWEILSLTKRKMSLVNDQDGNAGLTIKEFEKAVEE